MKNIIYCKIIKIVILVFLNIINFNSNNRFVGRCITLKKKLNGYHLAYY